MLEHEIQIRHITHSSRSLSKLCAFLPEPEGKIITKRASYTNKLRANFVTGILSYGVTLRSIDRFHRRLVVVDDDEDRALTLSRQVRSHPYKRRRLIARLFRRLMRQHRTLRSFSVRYRSVIWNAVSQCSQLNFLSYVSISRWWTIRHQTSYRLCVEKMIFLLFPSRIRRRLNKVWRWLDNHNN